MSGGAVERANRRVLLKAALVVVGMFGFGYALVPLYDVFCELTGIRFQEGSGRVALSDAGGAVDATRWVTVEFTGNTMSGLDWEFAPVTRTLRVHPGQMATAVYVARNTSGQAVVGQAVPSVTPSRATAHLKKTECFCFTQQRLEPGESREMPVHFFVDPGLPAEVGTITLSYAFFKSPEPTAKRQDPSAPGDAVRDGRPG